MIGERNRVLVGWSLILAVLLGCVLLLLLELRGGATAVGPAGTTLGSAPSHHMSSVRVGTSTYPPLLPSQQLLEPAVVTVGGADEQLAIVVRNNSDHLIRWAQVVITASDRAGNPIEVTTHGPGSTCCTMYGVEPGTEFGLFANLSVDVRNVERVAVHYVGLTATTATSMAKPRPAVTEPTLSLLTDDAVVEVTIHMNGVTSPYLAAQAFLVDPHNRLVAVLSGRFYCFSPGTVRRIRIQLLHPAPPNARLSRVIVDSIAPGIKVADVPTCPRTH